MRKKRMIRERGEKKDCRTPLMGTRSTGTSSDSSSREISTALLLATTRLRSVPTKFPATAAVTRVAGEHVTT